MKKLMTLAMMMVMTIAANGMSYTQAKNEALFLSDKMAYELNLTAAQYDAVYEINLDYMLSVNGRNDVLGIWWDRRNIDLQYVLTAYQYNKYMGLSYFYRPLSWKSGTWIFNIYSHYTNRSHFYKALPTVFVSYKGGNNKKPATHYASRKPIQDKGHARSVTGRNNHHNVAKPSGMTAQNTSNKKNGHFGNRR